jgi:pimeloyl-ACP methyl ester carboxylesterase
MRLLSLFRSSPTAPAQSHETADAAGAANGEQPPSLIPPDAPTPALEKPKAGLVAPSAFDLQLTSGKVHCQSFGDPNAPLVLCLPGLSQTSDALRFIGERLGGDDLRLVAVDLRGRGKSDATGKGTYGWESHAKDVLEIAQRLKAERFSIVGQSMGAFVGMVAVGMDPSRIDRLVLMDACGWPDASTGDVFKKRLLPQALNFKLMAAVKEDAEDALKHGVTIHERWKTLENMDVLLLRATREVAEGKGYVVPAAERDRFQSALPRAAIVEIDADHFGINESPATVEAIGRFLKPATSSES